MMGLRFTGEVPFSDVYIHSVIQAPDGRRMWKPLGTGIDPLDEIDRHGADAVRFGLLAMSSSQDVRYSAEKVRQGQALANKLFNATRFALLRIAGLPGVELGAVEPAPRPARDSRTAAIPVSAPAGDACADTAAPDRGLRLRPRRAPAPLRLRLRPAVRLVPRDRQAAVAGVPGAQGGATSGNAAPGAGGGEARATTYFSDPNQTASEGREDREALAATLLYVLRETVALAHPGDPVTSPRSCRRISVRHGQPCSRDSPLPAGRRLPDRPRRRDSSWQRVVEAVRARSPLARQLSNAPPGSAR